MQADGPRPIKEGRTWEGATRCQCLVRARLLDYFLSDVSGVKKTETTALVTNMTAYRQARRADIASCNRPDRLSRRNLVTRWWPTPAGGPRLIEGGRICQGATRYQCVVLARHPEYFLSNVRGK